MHYQDKTRRIPRSQWAIPLPKRPKGRYHFENDTFDGMAYEDAEALLQSLGFARQFERKGYSYGDVRFLTPENPLRDVQEEIHALWAHPAGIAIEMGTYRLTDDKQGPVRPRLRSMQMSLQLDTGSYRGNYIRLVKSGIGGSGGTTPLLHGGNAHYKSMRVGAICDRGLLSILEAAQTHARLIPFDRWVEKGRSFLGGDEMWFGPPALLQEDFGKERGPMADAYADQAQAAFEKACPHMLPSLVEELRTARTPRGEGERHRLADETWHKAEETVNYFLRTLEAAGICWPKPKDATLLSQWTTLVADHGAIDDLTSPVVLAEGPAGLSYARALLACVGRPGNAERFLDLVDRVDEKVLHRWATQPDAGGLNLVGQIVATAGDASMSTSSQLSRNAAEVAVLMQALEVIVQRLGPDGLSMGTDMLPLPALLRANIREIKGTDSFDLRDQMLVARMGQVVEQALNLGVGVGPLPDSAAEDIARLRRDHGNWEGMSGMLAAMEQHQLGVAAEQASSLRTSRPRL